MSDPTARAQALRHLENGDAQAAFRLIQGILRYPGRLDDVADFAEVLGIFAEISEAMAGAEFAAVVRRAASDTDDVEALYDLGYRLYEERLYGIAATVLSLANERAPGQAMIVSELVCNLEHLMLNERACEVLRGARHLVENDRFCRYLLAFNSVLAGDVESARELLPRLLGSGDPDQRFMAEAIAGMLARADAVAGSSALDHRDLRGWHLVVNGGVLLHLSPHGFDEGMNGRYAYLSDAYSLLREGLDRLAALAAATALVPPVVYALPERSSRIVGRAAAAILDRPYREWPAGGARTPGLIVAYDLDEQDSTEVLDSVKLHRSGQILFAHASCWTDPFPFTPDITTYLYQAKASPWGGGAMRVDPDTDELVQSEPDDAPDEELARRIVDAEPDPESRDDRDELHALIEAVRDLAPEHAAGLFRHSGRRRHQRIGSAVKSNRFA